MVNAGPAAGEALAIESAGSLWRTEFWKNKILGTTFVVSVLSVLVDAGCKFNHIT